MSDDAIVNQLFERYHDRLARQVSRYTSASAQSVEDACSFAWLQRTRVRPDESRTWQWLFRVASRESWRLHHQEATQAGGTVELQAMEHVEDPGGDPKRAAAVRDALARLQPRQRQLLALQAAGLTYAEMTAATGDSFRTVDRQLVRARAAVRRALAA